MPGIIIPNDRTIRQQATGYCINPECRGDEFRFEFPVNNDLFACPKCGAETPPMVGLLVVTHMLIADSKGELIGALGKRYRLACDSRRAYLATLTNMEAATGQADLADCPGCLAEMERLGLTKPQGFVLKG